MSKKKKNNIIPTDNVWTFEFIDDVYNEIERIGKDYLKLDIYPNQIEIISADQMIDAYASHGLPIMYNHWKFGKDYLINLNKYKKGMMGLAYEIVLNTNPCISFNMEDNTACMTTLVIAHAAMGHNHFFKNNYLFRQWTDASSIVDYLNFAKNYIKECEQKYGEKEVEVVLDACHALQYWGVDKYKRTYKSKAKEQDLYNRVNEENEKLYDYLMDKTAPIKKKDVVREYKFPVQREENILYFVEKYAPKLETWKKELIRITRKLSQYFYPQIQTKVLNEGCATFVHYHILNTMFDEGLVDEGFMMEFLASHTSVVFQPEFNSPYYSGFNPYALGFTMLMDIKRMCEEPTDEDREWFPDVVGKNWLDVFHDIIKNYKDETFILQFLSPKVIRDFKMFYLLDDSKEKNYTVKKIHDERGYREIREKLASTYNWSHHFPDIQVDSVDLLGDRKLKLVYESHNNLPLHEDMKNKTLKYLEFLWGYEVELKTTGIDEIPKVEKEEYHDYD